MQNVEESSRKKTLDCFLGRGIGRKTFDMEHRIGSSQTSSSTRQRSISLTKAKCAMNQHNLQLEQKREL
jgi:hypothetical protein